MEDSTQFLFAASCVILVTWYGIHRIPRRDPLEIEEEFFGIDPPAQTNRLAHTALLAEFRDSGSSTDTPCFPGGTVHCPDCGTVYPAGVMYCDCGAETIEVEEPDESLADNIQSATGQASREVSEISDDLVCVHVADNYWKASLLKSYLENHSIPCAIGGNSSSGPYPFNIGPMCEVRLFVYHRQSDQAKRLLKRLASN